MIEGNFAEKLFTNYVSARKTFLDHFMWDFSLKFDFDIGDFPMVRPKGHVLDRWPGLDIREFRQDFIHF